MLREIKNYPALVWVPGSRERLSDFVIKLDNQTADRGIGLHFDENCMIITSTILSQYTSVTRDDRQTDNIMTIAGHCNKISTFG